MYSDRNSSVADLWQAAKTGSSGSSFVELCLEHRPDVLPNTSTGEDLAPHGTTIVSLTYPGGVVLAGDRRATMGNIIAHRGMRKIYRTDDYSCAGIAGTAGLAIEMVKLFQVELEHYEKIEGTLMSLEGKANRLALMVRNNLGAAMQGLSVVPLFAGYDLARDCGRIFSYDVTGGRYEEHNHHAVGSGSLFARGSLKKLYRPAQDRDQAISVALEALWDAADDDSATGGPDLGRGIFPIVATVSAEGYQEVSQGDLTAKTEAIVAQRRDEAQALDHDGGR